MNSSSSSSAVLPFALLQKAWIRIANNQKRFSAKIFRKFSASHLSSQSQVIISAHWVGSRMDLCTLHFNFRCSCCYFLLFILIIFVNHWLNPCVLIIMPFSWGFPGNSSWFDWIFPVKFYIRCSSIEFKMWLMCMYHV